MAPSGETGPLSPTASPALQARDTAAHVFSQMVKASRTHTGAAGVPWGRGRDAGGGAGTQSREPRKLWQSCDMRHLPWVHPVSTSRAHSGRSHAAAG